MNHELKTWTEYFEAVAEGNKTFEVRKNDRNYQVGDRLTLREWEMPANHFDNGYTGRMIEADVKYTLTDPNFVKEGYVIMGIEVV